MVSLSVDSVTDHRASLERADFHESVLFWQTASILVRARKPKKFRLLTYNNNSTLIIYHSKAFECFLEKKHCSTAAAAAAAWGR